MLVRLVTKFAEGKVPCIPVPLSSDDLPETDAPSPSRHKSLHAWKQSSVGRALMTAIYHFIVDPHASVTVRGFFKYTRDQLQREKLMEASQCTDSDDARNLSQYIRNSPATYGLFHMHPTVGGVVTVGGLCLLLNGTPCAEAVVLGQQKLEVCQSPIPSIDAPSTRRFAVIVIVESKNCVTEAMRYAPQMESEVLKKLQARGYTTAKVDIMMIVTQGWCKALRRCCFDHYRTSC